MQFEKGSTNNAELEARFLERDEVLAGLKGNIHKAQQTMKNRADDHRREVEFQVGDQVFLKLRPYRQRSLARRIEREACCALLRSV